MKKANYILATICSIIAGAVIVIAMGYPEGKDGVPGPGVFPIIIASIIIASSVAIIISSIRMKAIKISWVNETTRPVYMSMGAVVLYTALLSLIGFVVTSIIFATGMIQWNRKGNPFVNVVISTIFVGIVYWVFSGLLNVPMDFGFLI